MVAICFIRYLATFNLGSIYSNLYAVAMAMFSKRAFIGPSTSTFVILALISRSVEILFIPMELESVDSIEIAEYWSWLSLGPGALTFLVESPFYCAILWSSTLLLSMIPLNVSHSLISLDY